MTSAVRTGLLAALASLAISCGGGGNSPPPPPPPPGPPPPGSNAPPTFTSPAAVSVRENAIGVIYRPLATDPEGNAITYGATIGGPDAARFTINPATREVRFAAQPDFEVPNDAGANNVYDISFTASDGTNTVTQNVAVSVTNTGTGFRVRRLATGLSAPVFVTGLPDGTGRLVVVERAGRIRIMDATTGAVAATDLLDLTGTVSTTGEKGLLGIAFSPSFLVDRAFYIHLNPNSANTTEIRQYRTQASSYDRADTSTTNAILVVPQPSTTNHKGGMLLFDPQGRLLIGMGDGGGNGDPSNNAQDRTQLLGKVLRVDVTTDSFPTDDARDYAIPTANPFAAGGGAPEVWLFGLRNPFRGSVDPVTGDVFLGDVGQDTIEEIDRVSSTAGGLLNYGWNRREGSQPFNGGANDPSFILPVTEYDRNVPQRNGESVTGGVVYSGPIDSLQGQYLFGDFISNNLWSVPAASLNVGSVLPSSSFTVRNSDFTPNAGSINSVVAFGTDNDGNVYFVDIGGEVFVLEPN
jgi:glucose/arabinose dehydrogenase